MPGFDPPALRADRGERRIGEEIRDIGAKEALGLLQRENGLSR